MYPRDSGELLKGLNRGCDRPVLLFSGSFWLLWGEWPGVSLRGFRSGRESQVRGLCLVAVMEMRTQTNQREIYRQNSHDLEQSEVGKRRNFWTQTCRAQVRWFSVLFFVLLCPGTHLDRFVYSYCEIVTNSVIARCSEVVRVSSYISFTSAMSAGLLYLMCFPENKPSPENRP